MMKKILIVDDNSTNLYLLKSLLEGEGFDVIAAENGQAALDSAHADPPDLIVSDILMPVMDGYLFCRQCKEDERLRQIPFVFYTATYTEPKDEKFALSLGADRFVLKPQEPETMIRILQEVWEERSAAGPAAPKPFGEEMEFFRQYNEVLFRKLEKKMLDLETANQKLKCLEEQYRLSFENVTDIIWTIDADLNVRKMSPSVERMLGYRPQDFIDRSVSDLVKIVAPESMERAMAEISSVLNGQTIPTSVYSLVARDGAVKQGEISGAPILRNGDIVGMVSVVRDITQRNQAEEKLKESEKKYRELYDFLPIPVYEMDFEANITSANRAVYEAFRGTEDDLQKGFKAWQLLSPEEVDKSARNIQRLLKGEQIGGTEYTLRRLDGSVFPAIVISDVICHDGKPVGLRGAIVDITERKQVEEELRESEHRYRLLVENANEAIMVIQDGIVRFVNGKTLESYGYSEQEFLSIPIFELIHPDDRERVSERYLQKIHGDTDPTRHTLRTLHKSGRIIWITISSVLIEWEGRPATLNLIVDMTEQKQAEEALLNTTERLRRSLAGTVQAISMAVETRDPYTAGHQRRAADLARTIAMEMGLPADRIDFVRISTSIHDIGKISVPAEILSKPTKLREIEFSMIKVHPQAAYDILKDIDFPWPVAEVILQHHERMDGSGYPKGLKGEAILLEARIVSVADVVEAIASHRPYRAALGVEAALEEISKNRGILYDPVVVDACLELFHEKGYNFH
jgi:PAS domain S-box-containing protein